MQRSFFHVSEYPVATAESYRPKEPMGILALLKKLVSCDSHRILVAAAGSLESLGESLAPVRAK